jgi:hypothetical protein
MPDRNAFIRYLKVQKSGVTNMLDRCVQDLADITSDEHLYIIKHYSELAEKYGVTMDDVDIDN